MQTYKLTLAYDGTDFAGWQIQPGERTVQGVLERALARVAGSRVRTVASGRTDAGVHALAQIVSFQLATDLDHAVLCRALDANTPADVVVRDVCPAPAGFHAIRDALSKRYRYLIDDNPRANVFGRHYAWQVRHFLDAAAMQQAAESLAGRHDCAAFQAAGSPRGSTVRTIHAIRVERCGDQLQGTRDARQLLIEIAADGFLYNMVRNIVGTLVEIGRGKQPVAWMAAVLASRDRARAGPTAPPRGLFLVDVRYRGSGAGEPVLVAE